MGSTSSQARAEPQTQIVHLRFPQDLEPEPGAVGESSWQLRNAVEWRKRLLADADQWPRCFTLVDGDDEAGDWGEVAVWLSRSVQRDKIVVRRARSSISSWLFKQGVAEANPGRAKPGDAPSVTGVEASVDEGLADLLEKSWGMMMNRVVQPRGEPARTMHPVWYHFVHWDEIWHLRGGRCEGPEFERLRDFSPNSARTIQLATLARRMAAYAEAPPEKRPAIRDVLFRETSQFLSSLRALGEVEPKISGKKAIHLPPTEVPSNNDGGRRTSR